MTKPVRVGCYSGFWGDSPHAARQMLEQEKDGLDYLVADYLAEVTMGLLARRSRFNKRGNKPGYIDEIVPLVLTELLPKLVEYKTKFICNAGGLDPEGLKEAIEKLAQKLGLQDKVRVASVSGDDISATYSTQKAGLTEFSPFGNVSGPTLESKDIADEILSVNAYIGCNGLVAALREGATIVVTGRCVDSALAVAPAIFEHGWDFSDFDRLAGASLAGHIIECGAQATGGNFTDWRESAFSPHGGWANMGYSIVEIADDASFIVTKPRNSGGVVSTFSVGEQMIYETLDPAHYFLPDVILDLTQVRLTQLSPTRVLVQGARGAPPTPWLKCTAISTNGFRLIAQLGIVGFEAREKALALGNAILARVGNLLKERHLAPFSETRVEAIGSEHIYGKHAQHNASREVYLRLSAVHDNVAALRLLSMEISFAGTSTAPAITGGGAGRAAPAPRFATHSFMLNKSQITQKVSVGNKSFNLSIDNSLSKDVDLALDEANHDRENQQVLKLAQKTLEESPARTVSLPLIKLAVGRSGDKGDNANVGFMARSSEFYPYLVAQVTEERLRDVFSHLLTKDSVVKRFLLPGSNSINFVVTYCLGGGGLKSVRFDKQAKAYAQIALSVIEISIPEELLIAKPVASVL